MFNVTDGQSGRYAFTADHGSKHTTQSTRTAAERLCLRHRSLNMSQEHIRADAQFAHSKGTI